MKAIVFNEYGSPDVLVLEDVAKPVPKENEVLIKVHAASVNDWDWGLLRGVPFVNRLTAGFPKPKKIKILGCDVAGKVEAVGKNVKQFQPGDEVFGDISKHGFGSFAEYVCAGENALAMKPASMTFEQAAAIPQAGVLALSGLKKGQIKQGQKVLINGASGGTGSFAVQMAKSFGAEVTGVCRTSKLEFVRSLGADHVIDFMKQDFTKNGKRYDLILDLMAYHSFFDYKRALNPEGNYVVEGGATGRIFQILIFGSLISMFGSKKMGLLILEPNKGLSSLIDLFEAGNFVPVIDKCYPLSKAAEAMRYFGEGYKKGKVVITLEQKTD
jgi:NADPH:quinone reductase-like Zn-dependent oxidoreductase